eukprot:scaffold43801_cov21-Tisochrysis_lutea.AAC.1
MGCNGVNQHAHVVAAWVAARASQLYCMVCCVVAAWVAARASQVCWHGLVTCGWRLSLIGEVQSVCAHVRLAAGRRADSSEGMHQVVGQKAGACSRE